MNREEFLEILNTQLQGEIPSPEVAQHLAYYNSFIDQKLRQGQSEADIFEELGDPRLIAKTLIDTEDVPYVHGYQQSYAYSAEEVGSGEFAREEQEMQGTFQEDAPRPEAVHWLTSTWYGKLTVAAVFLLLTVLLFFLLRALLPVVAMLILVGLILSVINRHR